MGTIRFLKIKDAVTGQVRIINISNIIELRKNDNYNASAYEVIVSTFRNHTNEVIRVSDDDYAELLRTMMVEGLVK
jgi:hypothetical protein